MSLYDELTQFQILPNAYEDWSEYRFAITDYLISQTDSDSTIAIFGAGRCNDIDLSELTQHFRTITLLDVDMSSMQKALATYHIPEDGPIHCVQCSFTGITPSDYRELADELTSIYNINGQNTDIHILSDYACFKLDKLYQKSFHYQAVLPESSYDYSVAFGVHSQINNMPAWIFSVFTTNLNQSDPVVENKIIAANNRMIPRLNDLILHATKKAAFFGCELRNYAREGSIQGSCQCIDDLRKRGIIKSQAVTVWPFSPASGTIYEMLLLHASCDFF